MAHEGLHESIQALSEDTRDMHRALVSLQEELEATDWYRQRADACTDARLKAILLHNMRDEMEHAAMLVEWLRRSNDDFDDQLRTYVFTDAPIVEIEAQVPEPAPAADDRIPTIGALKEQSA
ncbi:MAG: ferritin family protein [Thiobacillus sp.]